MKKLTIQYKIFYKVENDIEDGIRTLRLRCWESPIPKTTCFIHFLSIVRGSVN